MNIITGRKYDAQGIKRDNGYIYYNTEEKYASGPTIRWASELNLIPDPKQFSSKFIMDNPGVIGLMKKTEMTTELERFAKWFNENQWRGSKGDKLKALFCSNSYDKIVKEYLKK
jgi:hypothetical protein